MKRFIARYFNTRAIALEDRGSTDRAIDSYRRAARWDRTWSVPWYNLGLLYKYQRRWTESLEHNRRAVELNANDEGAWWNLGIAATALRNWPVAREAWRACGIDIPDDGPPDLDLGPVPIRLNPDTDGEVVWCRRIDPARAEIWNVPLPESGHRCGDVVLNDGARNGSRFWKGTEVPVFDELEIFESSFKGTFVIELSGISASEAETLVDQAQAAGLVAEDWTTNIQQLCKACSEGRVEHDHTDPAESTTRLIGLAAPSEASARHFIDTALGSLPDVDVERIECAITPLPEH